MRRLYWTALVMDAAFFCGWATVPFLVKRGDALHLDDAALGLLLALSALAYAGGAFWLAPLWANRNQIVFARLACLGTALSFVLAAMATARWQLFVWLCFGRLCLSVFWPNLMALVGEAPRGDLERRISDFNCWWSSGKALAFLACAALLDRFGDPRVALVVCGVVATLPVFLVPSQCAAADVEPAPMGVRGSQRLFLAGLVGVFVAWFVGAIWENQFPKGLGEARFAEVFGKEGYAFWINQLLFALYGGQAVMFFVLRAWRGWPMRAWMVVVGAVLIAASQVGTLVSHSPVVVALLLFAGGAGFAVVYAQSLYHAQAGRADKVRRSGIHEGTLNLGTMLGPPVAGGLVVATSSFEAAFVVTVIAGVGCLVGVSVLIRR